MFGNTTGSRKRPFSKKRLELGASLVALATMTAVFPASAQADSPLGSMVGMQAGRTIGPNGQVSVWQGANRPVIGTEGDRALMTIKQTERKAILDWEDFRLKTQEILEFQQQSSDWFVINRVHGEHAAQIDGEIRAIGSVYIFNDNGVLIGEDAQINTRQLVVGSGISDVDVADGTTTFVQSAKKAVLDWKKFEVQTDEVLKFAQQSSDWIVFNRDLNDTDRPGTESLRLAANTTIDGRIEADGILVVNDDTGFNIGEDAEIEANRYFLTQGVSDIDVTDTRVSITQERERAVISWSDMNLASGQSIRFHQEGEGWMALNRHLGGGVAHLDGNITADAGLLLVSRDGLAINGSIEAGQVVASALEIRDFAFNGFQGEGGLLSYEFRKNYRRIDPTFSNSWIYADTTYPDQTPQGKTDRYLNLLEDMPVVADADNPLRFAVTVGRTGTISTGDKGKIMLFGPNVTNSGTLNVQDEGQVVLGAGDNIFIERAQNNSAEFEIYTSVHNPLDMRRSNVRTQSFAPQFLLWARDSSASNQMKPTDSPIPAEWVDFVNAVTGGKPNGEGLYQAGDILPKAVAQALIDTPSGGGEGNLILRYLDQRRLERANKYGFTVRNDGVINGTAGSDVDLRGWTIEQNGGITLTSTANFRADISIHALMQDHAKQNGDAELAGNGTIVFGEGSITQITPDLNSNDMLPLTEGNQSVGSLHVAGGKIHFLKDSLVYLPSGTVELYADADGAVRRPLGSGGNPNGQDGSRLVLEAGATIDLSGWDVSRAMGYHQVAGRVFVAQLRDTPVQRGGPLYRKEIKVDRRYGTNVADWQSFDNLNQLTLDQMIVDGGTLTIASGDDFIMKDGSVIDVSGGSITYDAGYVYTTMLRRLDGTIVDIREADPDEVFMGLADQWVDYDTKWGKQKTYYVPLVSSARGRYEDSYVEGGNAGKIGLWAPDGVYQGTFRGEVTVGKYQRTNMPDAGSLIINREGEHDAEYVSDRILITKTLPKLDAGFGLTDSLTSVYGDIFGLEEERRGNFDRNGNLALFSEEMFERSTMGDYEINQWHYGPGRSFSETADDGYDRLYIVIEDGVDLNFANGADFRLIGTSSMYFGGSLTTNGGDVALRGQGIIFGENSFIDTSAKWHTEFETTEYLPLAERPIVDAGNILITAFSHDEVNTRDDGTYEFRLPETVYFNANGGGYLDRDGNLTAGKGGDINIRNYMQLDNPVELAGAFNSQALGLGGNGVFALESSGELYVGEALPADAAERNIIARIDPALFEEMPFSGIYLNAPRISVAPGTAIKATKATMQLAPATLGDGILKAWRAETGSNILDVTTTGYVEPGWRAKELRDGALVGFTNFPWSTEYAEVSIHDLGTYSGSDGARTTLGKDASLEVNPGGRIIFHGDLAGTLIAPAGTIELSGHLASTARVLAQGALRITDRRIDGGGNEVILGDVLSGGEIASSRGAEPLVIEKGAILDVSGTSAQVHVPVRENGAVSLRPKTIASDGGLINLFGGNIDVNNATFRAFAGGEGARGGTFRLQWHSGRYEKLNHRNPLWLRNSLTSTWYTLKDGTGHQGLVGVDLSTVDFDRSGMEGLDFPEGTYLPDVDSIVALFEAYYEAETKVPPPVLYIGEGEIGGKIDYGELPEYDHTFLPLYRELNFILPTLPEREATMTLSPVTGGFSRVDISAGAMVIAGTSTLGARSPDGGYLLDEVTLRTPRIYARDDGDFTVLAEHVRLLSRAAPGSGTVDQERFEAALADIGITPENTGVITLEAGRLLELTSADFIGYEDVTLISGGDLRLAPINYNPSNNTAPEGLLRSNGNLTLKADQIYAASGRNVAIEAAKTLTIKGPDAGTKVNATPLEGGSNLTLRAPRIEQGGIVRAPLGSITLEAVDDGSEGAGTIRLLPGSITSVSADGNVIPYGSLQNGDTWVDPFTQREMAYLPDREVSLKADVIDIAANATVDVSAGGDLVASEFVPGVGGSNNWLTGYRDDDYRWVDDASQVYAIIPGYDAGVTPLGTGDLYDAPDLGKIYLSGAEGGLPAGEYTLLPAEYAALPGAYRVTANHQYGDYSNIALGESAAKPDGSIIQAGYRFTTRPDGSLAYRDPFTNGFLVMDREVLSLRSQYNFASATTYFDSDAFLRAAQRRNLQVDSLPRTPKDAGGLTLIAGSSLTLDGTINAAAMDGGKGGYVDVSAARILVAGAGTDRSGYDGYLQLDADRLVSFGVESLLLGGVRGATDTGTAIQVTAADLVIDTAGDVLSGADLIFTAQNGVTVKSGSIVEATGELASATDSYALVPVLGEFIVGSGSSENFLHGELDQGAVLHVSAGDRADFLRDEVAIDAMAALRADPARLAAINAQRRDRGMQEIDPAGGVLAIEEGVRLAGRSVVLDGTRETTLSAGTDLAADQITAAASQVSIGAAPAGTGGLVFAGDSASMLANAQDLALKSYSSIDFYGAVEFTAEGDLTLDARQIQLIDNDGGAASITARTLTFANSNGGSVEATGGSASLLLSARDLLLTGGVKAISGANSVTLRATRTLVGQDAGGLNVPGALAIEAGQISVDNGDVLAVNAGGAITIDSIAGAEQASRNSLGATLSFTGTSITHNGQISLHAGTVNLRATAGDVTLAQGSGIDVSGTAFELFDRTIGLNAGAINLTADRGNVVQNADAVLDISGGAAGNAGSLAIVVPQGQAVLNGALKGGASEGKSAGDFALRIGTLADFAALSSTLAAGGLNGDRSFEILSGSVTLDGVTEVESLSVIAHNGTIDVTGTVRTVGANGGDIRLAASNDVTLGGSSALIAAAEAEEGAGGLVKIETAGANGGRIAMASGARIDVSGAEDRGGTVHFRAPQIGDGDVAIDSLAGTVTGADRAIAEAYRVYDGVEVIDRDVAAAVAADATAFMEAAAANNVQARLGSVTLVPGIDIRNDGDVELTDDWDLAAMRYGADQVAGVLSLRAAGDMLINANLTDSATDAPWSWNVNLVGGANLESPSSLAVLSAGQLADGKGSVIIGGEADQLDYAGLSPFDYDMSVIVGELDVPSYGGAVSSVFMNIVLGHRNPGEITNDEYRAIDRASRGDTPEETLYNLVELLLDEYPYLFAPSMDYDGAYQDLDNLIGAEYAGSLSGADLAEYQAIGHGSSGFYDGNATGKDAYVRLVRLIGEYPEVFYDAVVPIPTMAVPAAPYYLRVNGQESALFYVNEDGSLGAELDRDIVTGFYYYLDESGEKQLVKYAEGASEYADTDIYARKLLPWIGRTSLGFRQPYMAQTYDPVGYRVSTGSGSVQVAAGRDLVLEQRPSSIQATGLGSRISVAVGGDVVAHDAMAKTIVTDIITDGQAVITAGGAIRNLTVSARDLEVRAGGDILGGIYRITGNGTVVAGGSILSGSVVRVYDRTSDPQPPYADCDITDVYRGCDPSIDPTPVLRAYPLYTMFDIGEAGSLRVEAAGDLNVETATGGAEASVSLYSAGGDIIAWNNDANIGSARMMTGFEDDTFGPYFPYYVTTHSPNGINAVGRGSYNSMEGQIWPGTVEMVAAGGDVNVEGGFRIAPAPDGNLDILAQNNVRIGHYTRLEDAAPRNVGDSAWNLRKHQNNYRNHLDGIYMMTPSVYGEGTQSWNERHLLLHEGDFEPSRIYAGAGDIIGISGIASAEQLWMKAGSDVYFPNVIIQHNNPKDVSLITAGAGIYFGTISSAAGSSNLRTGSQVHIRGQGRLEIEAGTDLWIPNNSEGITADTLLDLGRNSSNAVVNVPFDPDMKGATVAISVGYNQQPSYEEFDAAYFDPANAGAMADYLLGELGDGEKMPMYLFDRFYARGNGATVELVSEDMAGGFVNYIRSLQGLEPLAGEEAQRGYLEQAWEYWLALPASQETPYDTLVPRYTAQQAQAERLRGEFFLPERRQGLVNYVREMQGLEPLETAQEQRAYMDEALAYWEGLDNAYKAPFYRSALFLELRTASREANDPDNERQGSVNRGYTAIGTLYPGAQKAADEQLADGESRWAGNFETFASRILSNAGGDVSVVAPGGFFRLASAAANADQTGQPSETNPQGDALRAGIVTQGGGEVNVLTHGDQDVNQSRVLTTQGGNIMMWSSFGSIAAGNGAKTSMTPPYFERHIDELANFTRSPAGLPTGAGIGTLASTPGVPPADVDLVANYGVVDAGDAGIRVSGNLNVFAIEILGADNIDVAGRTTGLPEAPAAPPTSLDVGDLGSKSLLGSNLLESLTETVRQNAAATTPSIIEVRVTGYGDCGEGDRREACAPGASQSSNATPSRAERAEADRQQPTWPERKMHVEIAATNLDEAMQQIGGLSGYNILYSTDVAANFRTAPLRGSMTLKQAISRLLRNRLRAVLIDDRTIMIEPSRYAHN
ncbi:filamentous hemagglutinin N-terminal domain-containing protein [Pelagerythrobacter rhizovicinus]|uniref:Filamentous hemagglutinin N-terminal domain-containing protein n=1 Tax=Pelagerythrobacter rhizovicinus TaxID=2268576 RepID=A0A4Q2KSJ2_9SPHN|nr:filamentous hemagglutinin N-terminal domain-containing protein [Pelagerythrobacter rhizovicinus]RXZ66311.1 filamentous hemagglutinin N-terminal domain-containing protein [Pelagerythrobacter rhizovicinus]